MNGELKLLVEWSSPWEEFKTAIRPAFMRSPEHLAGEANVGLFPFRGMLTSWSIEIALFFLFLLISRGLDTMHPYQPPPPPKYDVIYFSGDELPRIADAGGAQSGRTGRSGGREAHHNTQTIRVARGESLREKVVDAPRLNLPRSDAAVANLLAYKPVPGPPPAEGMKSSLRVPTLPQTQAIAPAPDVERDRMQAPSTLNSSVVAPAPDVQRDRMQAAPTLNSSVVAPAPEVQRDRMQSAPALSASAVPPAPSPQNIAPLRIPGSHPVQVVPPPVSAPAQVTNANPRLSLPAPTVVAPPPTQVTRELAKVGPGLGSGELQKQVVPPPVQMGSASAASRTAGGLGNGAVVPPPVEMGRGSMAHQPVNGLGGGTAVVPPPVQVGSGSMGRQPAGGLGGGTAVVPPPVQVGSGSTGRQPAGGLGGGVSAVPPPPTVGGGSSITGRGRGERGAGLGGLGEMGDVAAPPRGGGNAAGAGVVVSNQPGSKVGVPGGGGLGSLAMSPAGGANAGLGGTGGGAGIGRGNGPGSGLAGEGSGAGRDGTGRGSDPNARGGISPSPGPGGTGSGSGSAAMKGVYVNGGSTNVVNLPSFSEGGSSPTDPTRSSAGPDDRPGLVIEASPRSGGALNLYGALKGDKAYTIYIDSILGTVVMEYSDPTSAAHPYGQALSAPQPLRADLPANLQRSRLVIACILDRTGVLRSLQIMESASPSMAAKVLTALPSWKFRPALRANHAIDVNVILGFNIDTSDPH